MNNSNNKFIFYITKNEVQKEAFKRINRILSEEELSTVKKCIEWGLFTDIDTVFTAAIEEAITKQIHQQGNTSFGTSIFEPVAVALAQNNFKIAKAQYPIGTTISQEAQNTIQQIMNKVTIGEDPDKEKQVSI